MNNLERSDPSQEIEGPGPVDSAEPKTTNIQEAVRVDIALPNTSSPSQIFTPGREEYLNLCVPLYQAALKGKWKDAEVIIDRNNHIVRAAVTRNQETTLHIAAATKHKTFVKHLLTKMSKSDLALKNKDDNTAICFAAASGTKKIAEMMVDKNEDLPMIRGNGKVTPLYMAALFGHRKMVLYLYDKTDFERLGDSELVDLFHAIIGADIYDVALRMFEWKQSLATSQNSSREIALHLMARKPTAIGRERQLNIFKRLANSSLYFEDKMMGLAHQLVDSMWKLVVKLPEPKVSELLRTPTRLLFDAASSGNVEFLVILIRAYPDLLWKVDEKNQSLFHIAALNRHESIFNIIYELGSIKDLIAAYKEVSTRNNMLHLVASLPPPGRLQIVSGAALQMQRELLWFKAVKKIVPHSYIKAKNSKGEVAQDLFTEKHKELRKEGEKWMKDTATSCMLVSTLIATVVFAAPFTVPGGINDTTGFPILKNKVWFNVFLLSDAVALFSSSISIVIFLSILTSRYAEDDFLVSLPSRLMLGLLALFVSINSMVISFSATLFLIPDWSFAWNLTLLICLAFIISLSFALLHVKLWFDTLRSAYWSKYLFQSRSRRLYL
ncbi:BnaC09g51990D [Brassica napus]|uniref:PGG domain-containing protein n=2 Tax=Brassica TaxID=3705 RepID=A0A8X7QU41_BRACI|nr:hypothetical protein Bca52824_059280 [Brassica carinata]CAF1732550.1 unnamed protein product [Brassica napus]CDY61717.1 BnaC09g51990D [Brassica napus]